MRWACVWLALLAGCAVALHHDSPPTPPRQTHLGIDITQMHLTNGLRVVLVRDPLAAEVSVTTRYRVGAADDPAGQEGMAHLVEHLMFQQVVGTQSIFSHLDSETSYFNGNTTWDGTTFETRAEQSRLGELLAIEGVRAAGTCKSISEQVYEREREVVINEIRMRDEWDQVIVAIHAGLYPEGHPYRRAIVGSEATLRAITRDQACAFADAHYAPRNAVLVVSGNVKLEEVEAALTKYLLHVPSRDVVPPVDAPRVPMSGHHVETPAPIDDDGLVVAWPLPSDVRLRAKVRALAPIAATIANFYVRGPVIATELGDERAPMFALLVAPSSAETFEQASKGVERALRELPQVFAGTGSSKLDRIVFDLTKQGAINDLFGTLEPGSGRDTRLATYVFAGRDPALALAGEVEGLREMTRDDAVQVAREQLAYERALVVTLRHAQGKKRGVGLAAAPAIHDQGQRRDTQDPVEAHRPAGEWPSPRGVANARVRTLANGMHVVLLPLTSVPTVDVRLVFAAGTADEAADKRGAALVAARHLDWSLDDLNDIILMRASGSQIRTDVEPDHTTFAVRGLDMHLDLLLTGLERLVRNGHYARSAAVVIELMRRQAKKHEGDDGALTDAWRTARFGAHHPYVDAGRSRRASGSLSLDDAAQFGIAHYTPDNATLVIAGHFDVDLAERWIEYLFGDWTGKAPPRESRPATPHAASLARVDDTTQVVVTLAIPAGSTDRVHQVIAAQMLDQIASDVRHQLGASYTFSARLDDSRLAPSYVITGSVEAARVAEAMELLRTRIEQLRAGGDDAARAFVSARRRAGVKLLALAGTAETLADRVEHDFELGRAPLSDIATSKLVASTTLEGMSAALGDLDLTRAIIMMRGPAGDIERAYAVLGRRPTFVDAESPAAQPKAETSEPPISVGRVETIPIAPDPKLSPWTLAVAPGYTFGSVNDHDASGVSVAVEAGYGDARQAVGLRGELGHLSGSYMGVLPGDVRSFSATPIQLGAFVRANVYGFLWGTAFLGLHLGEYSESGMSRTDVGAGVGAEAGVDLVRLHRHRFGLYFRGEAALGAGTTAATLGLAYHL